MLRKRLGTLALLVGSTLTGQSPTAQSLVSHATALYHEQGARAALPEFERALALYQTAGDRLGEAVVLGHIGNCYKQFGEFPKALDYLQKALAIKRQLGARVEEGKTLSGLGLVYWRMADYSKATDHLTRSIAIAHETHNRQLEAAARNNLALVLDETGEYRRSIEQYRQALEIERAAGLSREESDTLGNIGGWNLLLGRFRECADYYHQALAISEQRGLKLSTSLDLGNLANCQMRLGATADALRSLDRALALARETGSVAEEADWRKLKGTALLVSGKYNAALDEYRGALRIYEKAGLKRELADALNDNGNVHLLLGDVVSAEQDFRRAASLARAIGAARGVTANLLALGDIQMRRKSFTEAARLYSQALARSRQAEDREYSARSLVQLAFVRLEQHRWEEAGRDAAQALESARASGGLLEAPALHVTGEVARRRGQYDAAIGNYTAAEKAAGPDGDPDLQWRIAYGQGQVLEALHRDEEAVAAYRRAIVTIESVRNTLREDRFRSGYLEDKQQVYVALVRLLLRLRQPDQAFYFAEKLRAHNYAAMLGGAPLRGRTPQEIELRERVRQLQRALDEESTRSAGERRAGTIGFFSAELAAAERAYQNLLDDLRSPSHEGQTADVLPAGGIQALVPPGTALLEYIVSPDAVTVFVVTKGGVRFASTPSRARDLEARVELLRDLVVREGSNEWEKPAESLRRILIGPAESAGGLAGVRKLYIVPHGILHYLPFSVLGRRTPSGLRLLVDDYVISYLPAASLLARHRPARTVSSDLLAAAPALARLEHSQEEARSLGSYFPSRSLVLVGRSATESAVKRAAGRYRLLHLATHGRFNKLNPLLSALELVPDRDNDGRLEVHEILEFQLRADLVTLSACDTGLGSGYFSDVPAGDDFVGLTRAFLSAGSAAVVASLWEVNDRSTAGLMQGFYGRLKRSGRAEALTSAQRAMLRAGGRYSHPYFWAPFVLVGEM